MTTIAKTPAALAKQLRQLTDTRNDLDWKIAGTIYAWTTTDQRVDRHKVQVFAAMKLPGFASAVKVKAYLDAYQRAIDEGIVPIVQPGDQLNVPSATFQTYYDRTDYRAAAKASKAKSIQGERQKETATPVATTPPRVSSVTENIERALRELDAALRKERGKNTVGVQQLQLAHLSVENALNAYRKATVKS
jgi:hypothetical protein